MTLNNDPPKLRFRPVKPKTAAIVAPPHIDRFDATAVRLALSVGEVAARLGVSKNKVYAAINEKRLVAKSWGRRTLIREADLQAFLDGLPDLQSLPTKRVANTAAQ